MGIARAIIRGSDIDDGASILCKIDLELAICAGKHRAGQAVFAFRVAHLVFCKSFLERLWGDFLAEASRLARVRRVTDLLGAEDEALGIQIRFSGVLIGCVRKAAIVHNGAFDYLSGFGLNTLLGMGSANFWRRVQPPAPRDIESFDRAFEALMLANELLAVHERDRTLMAPKLLAKSLARSSNSSDCEVFRVRSVCSQIGWLETSSAEVAAQAVSNVELLLSAGASESSVAIDHQLMVFEVNECGLLATWETADALICVPRIQI